MIASTLGWTLIHSTWEIAGIGLIFFLSNLMLRRASSSARYAVALLALVLCLVLPVATFGYLKVSDPANSPSISRSVVSVLTASEGKPLASAPAKPTSTISPITQTMATPTTVATRIEPLLPRLVLVWLVGLIAMCIRLAGGLVALHRLKRTASFALDDRLQALTEAVAGRIGLKRQVSLMLSGQVESPAVIGFFKSIILFPVGAVAKLSPGQIEALLAHELAHIRRHDISVNLFQSLIETVLFYHPAVWWISTVVRSEREHCCDDLAIQVTGDRAGYARALVCLEELRLAPQLAMAASNGSLVSRVRRILLGQENKPTATSAWAVMVVVLCLSLGLIQSLRGQISGSRGVSISGTLTAQDGSLVVDADVFLCYTVKDPIWTTAKATTDSRGRFQFDITAIREKYLLTDTNGLTPYLLAYKKGQGIMGECLWGRRKDINLRLSPTSPLLVQVRDNHKVPVQDLRLAPLSVFFGSRNLPVPDVAAKEMSVVTGNDGRTMIESIQQSIPEALQTLDQRFARIVRRVGFSEVETQFSVEAASGVRGIVTHNGKPASGILVYESTTEPQGPRSSMDREVQLTDLNGRFAFKRLTGGSYVVGLSQDLKSDMVASPKQVSLVPGQNSELQFQARHGGFVTIHIAGSGFNDGWNHLVNIHEKGLLATGFNATEDKLRNFRMRLPAGTYLARVETQHPGKATEFTVQDGVDQVVTIQVAHGTKIHVQVRDADGAPAAQTLLRWKFGKKFGGESGSNTDKNGEYNLYLSDEDAKDVRFKAQKGDQFSEPAVFAHDGKVEIRLHRVHLASVKGFVKDLQGRPIENAVVQGGISSDTGFLGDIVGWPISVKTNREGYYEFNRLYPGIQVLVGALAPGFADAGSHTYTIPQHGDQVIPDLKLSPASFIEGTVVDQHGHPVVGCDILADRSFRVNGGLNLTDTHGHFKIDRIAKGTHYLTITKHWTHIYVQAVTGKPATFTIRQ